MSTLNGIGHERVPVAGLKPHPRNYNRHDAGQVEDLRESLRQFGQVRSIVVQATQTPKTFLIVAGHGVTEAARQEGLKTLKADVIPATWTPARVLAYLAADNELARRGNPDEAQLAAIVAEVQAKEGDVLARLAAGEQAALNRLLALAGENEERDAEPQIDRAEELNKKWQVKTGDLWRMGEHRLLCGDSTKREDVERVMGGEKAHLVFTDPPYGVDYDGGTKVRKKLEGDSTTDLYMPCCQMAADFSDEYAALYLWHAGIKGIAAAAAAAAAGYEIRCEIVWNKNQAQYGALSAQYKQKHEPCYYCYKRGKTARWFGPTTEVTVCDIARTSINEFHPTQKPPDLAMRAMRNNSEADEIVADWFAGSGSTLVACQNLQRKCRAIEISPEYCAVILQRMADAFPGIEIERIGPALKEHRRNGQEKERH